MPRFPNHSDVVKPATKLPYMYMDELAGLLGYASMGSFRVAKKKGNMDVPTYRLGRREVADREVVKQYFLRKRELGLKKLKEIKE